MIIIIMEKPKTSDSAIYKIDQFMFFYLSHRSLLERNLEKCMEQETGFIAN